jgi:hypothetical protein
LRVPVIVVGVLFTVAVLVEIQPVGSVYVITGLPGATPVTTPVKVPAVACSVLLLLQLPPDGVDPNVVDVPVHTTAVPLIADGNGFTVIIIVVKQPVPKVYVMIGVPADTPVTAGPETVAIARSLLVHVPPAGVELSVVVKPTHTLRVPVIVDGLVFTVTTVVVRQPVAGIV